MYLGGSIDEKTSGDYRLTHDGINALYRLRRRRTRRSRDPLRISTLPPGHHARNRRDLDCARSAGAIRRKYARRIAQQKMI